MVKIENLAWKVVDLVILEHLLTDESQLVGKQLYS